MVRKKHVHIIRTMHQKNMLPLVFLAVSKRPNTPIDKTTINELHLCLSTIAYHNESANIIVIARKNDFQRLAYNVSYPLSLTFTEFNATDVKTTFAQASILKGMHHSGIGGASKLLLPQLTGLKDFIFCDTDIVFLKPLSHLFKFYKNMTTSNKLIAATKIRAFQKFRTRISSGLMIFKSVDPIKWKNAVIGALLLNPLNCDKFHWGHYTKPICITNEDAVGGDQEVISVIIDATDTLFQLPKYAHHIEQGQFKNVPNTTITLHYKNIKNALSVTQKHLPFLIIPHTLHK
jgi:hypothetical protein